MPAETGDGPQEAELVEGDVDVHGVRAGPPFRRHHLLRRPRRQADDRVAEAGGAAFDGLEGALDETLLVALPAATGDGRRGGAGQIDGVVARRREGVVEGRGGEGVERQRVGQQPGLGRRPAPDEVVETIDVALQAVPVAGAAALIRWEPVGGDVDEGLDDVAPPHRLQLPAEGPVEPVGRAARGEPPSGRMR